MKLRLHFVEALSETLTDLVQVRPKEWDIASSEEQMLVQQPVDEEGLAQERENYRSWAQLEHGKVVDPVTGVVLDIMNQ